MGAYIANSSAARDGVVYVGHYGGEVLALDLDSGDRIWTHTGGGEYQSSPAVSKDMVYIGGRDKKLIDL